MNGGIEMHLPCGQKALFWLLKFFKFSISILLPEKQAQITSSTKLIPISINQWDGTESLCSSKDTQIVFCTRYFNTPTHSFLEAKTAYKISQK